jgi:hypothetical protein
MTDDSADTDQLGERLPYVKPFVRNLDASDTEGKAIMDFENSTFHSEGPS